jgi:hypothetical protein
LTDGNPFESTGGGGEKVGYFTNVSSRNVWRSTGVDLMLTTIIELLGYPENSASTCLLHASGADLPALWQVILPLPVPPCLQGMLKVPSMLQEAAECHV